MFRWLTRLRGSAREPGREELLNESLGLAMDWGEDWLAPIQERLAQRHPHLGRDELDACNRAAQEAMRCGHETAYRLVRASGKDVAEADFVEAVRSVHRWIGDENAARLFRQSLYYAWKAGGPPRDA